MIVSRRGVCMSHPALDLVKSNSVALRPVPMGATWGSFRPKGERTFSAKCFQGGINLPDEFKLCCTASQQAHIPTSPTLAGVTSFLVVKTFWEFHTIPWPVSVGTDTQAPASPSIPSPHHHQAVAHYTVIPSRWRG